MARRTEVARQSGLLKLKKEEQERRREVALKLAAQKLADRAAVERKAREVAELKEKAKAERAAVTAHEKSVRALSLLLSLLSSLLSTNPLSPPPLCLPSTNLMIL